MKLIFTLLSFSFFGSLQAQFEAIVSRIRSEPIRKVTIPAFIGCGMYRHATLITMKLPNDSIPRVRRSLEGLDLPVRVTDYSYSLDTGSLIPQPQINAPKTSRVIIRCGTLPIPAEPILLVDGNLADSFSYLQKIPISEIEGIDSLKGPAATAIFGSRAVRGAYFVKTRKSKIRTLHIRDFQDRQPIPRATVRFISSDYKDTLQLIANDSGILVTDRLEKDMKYQVSVSAIGYRSVIFFYKNKFSQTASDEWLLHRNIISNEEVVIITYIDWKIKKISCCHLGRTRCETHQLNPLTAQKQTKVFPNPALPGQTISIEQDLDTAEKISLQVFNISGSLMGDWNLQAVKGLNQIRFNTGRHWASGTYFFRILYANGRVAASGSIIIQ